MNAILNLCHYIMHQFKFCKKPLNQINSALITSSKSTKDIAPRLNIPSKPNNLDHRITLSPLHKSNRQYYLNHPSFIALFLPYDPVAHSLPLPPPPVSPPPLPLTRTVANPSPRVATVVVVVVDPSPSPGSYR